MRGGTPSRPGPGTGGGGGRSGRGAGAAGRSGRGAGAAGGAADDRGPHAGGARGDAEAAEPALLVDAHAHFHACYEAERFLDAAVRNARRWRASAAGSARRRGATADSGASDAAGAGSRRGPQGSAARGRDGAGRDPRGDAGATGRAPGRGAGPRPCLLLADPAGRSSLGALAEGLERGGRWSLAAGGDGSRRAESASGGVVHLVGGRQVATSDGLEVLALATGASIPGGRSARATVEASLAAGAVTVLPWGFGKWWLRRGRAARELVESVDHPLFFLGDNGGRPRLAPEPALFRAARRRGTGVLPGTDPLPFRAEEGRVGSYGFVHPGPVPVGRAAPTAAVKRRLERLDGSPPRFGRRVGLARFLACQVGMQLRNRGPR